MINSTLIYIEKDGKYLMLHRIKKENDINKDKWIGIGGKFIDNESPYECAVREVKEETNLDINSLSYRGVVTFVSDRYETEYMHLFHTKDFSGEVNYNCNEGVLEWIDKDEVLQLPIWEGDKIFLDLLSKDTSFFSLKLEYQTDKLINYKLDI